MKTDIFDKFFDPEVWGGVFVSQADQVITDACKRLGLPEDDDSLESNMEILSQKTPREIFTLYLEWNGIIQYEHIWDVAMALKHAEVK